MFCPILKRVCIGSSCELWDNGSCLIVNSLKNTNENKIYFESHSVEEIAHDFIEFLQSISLGDKITDRDYYIEECFWREKIGVDPLPPELEQKRFESLRLAEQMYAEILFGDFFKAQPTDIAQKIVDWAKNNKIIILGETEIELFWKEHFGINLYLNPLTQFDKMLQDKFIYASDMAKSIIENDSEKKRQRNRA